MENLELISISSLLDKKFFIPAYQRGYRWGERQVLDLLEDILEFQQKEGKDKGEFYCLQPIVVTNIGQDTWEVIDGQQRLTTIYIILMYLNEARKIMFNTDRKYEIFYETREGSKDFLENTLTTIETPDFSNIDYFHISKAFLKIKEWFESRNVNKADFLNTLLKTDVRDDQDVANNIRFIWYEVDKEDVGNGANEKIFARINMGKIPLTNAELIKALFFINEKLQEKETNEYQFAKAYEWDNIENSLQDDDFWYFLNKEQNNKSARIEFIFDLIADQHAKDVKIKVNKSIDEYYTFYIFNEIIRKGIKPKEELWDEIKTYFRTFEEWYQDNDYYHLIGYLVHSTKNSTEDIKELKWQSETKSKTEFETYLIGKIKSKLKAKNIGELSYDDENATIHQVLLLFNVVTTMNDKHSKFPFKRYANEQWSLEHIHAQNSEELSTDEQRRCILKEQKDFYEAGNKDAGLLKDINNLLKKKVEIILDDFKKLQDEIFGKYSNDNKESLHKIDNLALLTKNDNSTLNNNIFPIKRNKIKELDEKGSFIPLCTKKVFLKYYSDYVEQTVRWDREDRVAYLSAIESTLKAYLLEEDTHGH